MRAEHSHLSEKRAGGAAGIITIVTGRIQCNGRGGVPWLGKLGRDLFENHKRSVTGTAQDPVTYTLTCAGNAVEPSKELVWARTLCCSPKGLLSPASKWKFGAVSRQDEFMDGLSSRSESPKQWFVADMGPK